MAGRKKRYWTDEEKCEICAQARLPDASVAQVARRYAVNANMVFKWLKDPRYVAGVQAGAIVASEGHDDFIELSVAGCSPPSLVEQCSAAAWATRIDITLSDGRHVLVEGRTALPAVIALVQCLAQSAAK